MKIFAPAKVMMMKLWKAAARANRARGKWNDRRNRGDAFRRAESLLREKNPPSYIGDSLLAAAKFADDFFCRAVRSSAHGGRAQLFISDGARRFLFLSAATAKNLFRAIAFALAAGNAAICEIA